MEAPHIVTQEFQSPSPLPKVRCPVCNEDIDVSKAKYSEPLSICHGQVTITPVPGTLVGIDRGFLRRYLEQTAKHNIRYGRIEMNVRGRSSEIT